MNHANNHYVVMFFIMLASGALSTMNVWANSVTDINFSLNDVYMILLMTGWMFLFMGVFYKEIPIGLFGAILTIVSFVAIRTQAFVTETEFLKGMIPHHSMAVFMSKKLQEKPNSIQPFLEGILRTQSKEIQFMKERI